MLGIGSAFLDSPSLIRWHRHLAAFSFLVGLALLFTLTRGGELSAGVLGLGFADAAVILLCVTLTIGPAARLAPGLAPLLTWRRPLGIATGVAAILHVIAFEAYDYLGLPKLFLDRVDGHIVIQQDVVAAASWIGVAALVYVVALVLTSNDFSQRLLGSGWKRLHQHSHTFFVLAALHTGIALYLIEESRGGVFPYILWVSVVITIGIQVAEYIYQVRQQSLRKHREENPPEPAKPDISGL